jgi:hypothetical protein
VGATTEHIDVTAAMNASSSGRRVKLSILGDESTFDVMTASMFEPEGEGAIK